MVKKFGEIPVRKGDILTLGAVSVGKNGDLMFMKDKFRLFLKNIEGKAIELKKLVKIKVVKLFDTLGYVELI